MLRKIDIMQHKTDDQGCMRHLERMRVGISQLHPNTSVYVASWSDSDDDSHNGVLTVVMAWDTLYA